MYIINQQKHVSGYGEIRRCVSTHENLNDAKKKLCELISTGIIPTSELSITKEIPFEFKCAVVIKDKEEV